MKYRKEIKIYDQRMWIYIINNTFIRIMYKGFKPSNCSKAVIAVKMAIDLVDVYITDVKAYYHYNFKVIG